MSVGAAKAFGRIVVEIQRAETKHGMENEKWELADWLDVIAKQTDDLVRAVQAKESARIQKELTQIAVAATLAQAYLFDRGAV